MELFLSPPPPLHSHPLATLYSGQTSQFGGRGNDDDECASSVDSIAPVGHSNSPHEMRSRRTGTN